MPRVQMAHFSPSCVHHSQANAKKVEEQPATLFDHINGTGPERRGAQRLRLIGTQPSHDVMPAALRRRPPARPDGRRELTGTEPPVDLARLRPRQLFRILLAERAAG